MDNIRRHIVMMNKIQSSVNPKDMYFTIEALEDGLTAKLSSSALEYRIDKGEWLTLNKNTNTQAIDKGHTLSFKAVLNPIGTAGIGTFTISKQCKIKGNIMSLLFGDDFKELYSLYGKSGAFARLFSNCTTISDGADLVLPATVLSNMCYYQTFLNTKIIPDYSSIDFTSESVVTSGGLRGMFYGTLITDEVLENLLCTNDLNKYCLPVENLSDYCYLYMFTNCVNLTTAPKLPATILTTGCYQNMFAGCTSLTSAPELPAMTLAEDCYNSMFSGCNSLEKAPDLLAETLYRCCYSYMFRSTNLKVIPKIAAINLDEYCCESMFSSCKSLTEIPALPAKNLAEFCYYDMFGGCTNVTYIQDIVVDTTELNCFSYMFSDCTSLVNAPKITINEITGDYCCTGMFARCTSLKYVPELSSNLGFGCYWLMFLECTALETAPVLSLLNLAEKCYSEMFYECTSLINPPVLSATELKSLCYRGMFLGCTSLTTAPELLATKLEEYCYESMFKNCNNLNYIKMTATENLKASYCLSNWVKGVSTEGTFVKSSSATLNAGDGGIPNGWNVINI